MKRIAVMAGAFMLFGACSDSIPTQPGPAVPQPSYGAVASRAWVITTYIWSDGAWLEQATWPDPTEGGDAEIGFWANNANAPNDPPDAFPEATFIVDEVTAPGTASFPDGVVDDFGDGFLGSVWGRDGSQSCETSPWDVTLCEGGGVLTIHIPEGPGESGENRGGGFVTPGDVLYGPFDVRLKFALGAEFAEGPLQAHLGLNLGHGEGHHAILEIGNGWYTSGDYLPPETFTPYRRTMTDDLDGTLRITRRSVTRASRVVESVSGSGSFHVTTQQGDWRTFAFTAYRRADGTVNGEWRRVRRMDGDASEAKSHGVVTCFLVLGDEAWIGGYATSGLYSEPPYNYVRWAVKDNGEGNRAPADQISLQDVGYPWGGAANFCANAPQGVGLFELEVGDIQIRRR